MNVGCDVGLRVGLIGAPDIADASVITNIGDACRKCRASRGGGTAVDRRTDDLAILTCLASGTRIAQLIHIIGLE